MNRAQNHARRATLAAGATVLLALAVVACGDEDDSSEETDGNQLADAGAGDASAAADQDGVDEAVLAACPQAATLIQTSEWSSCLSGRRLTGSEPFGNLPCELRVGANGAFEYLRDGALAIAVPERSLWRGATGTYQNEKTPGSRIFIAGLAPDLEPVVGQPRVTDIDISIFSLASQQDKVAVRYLDATLARQTYNCTIDNAL